MLYQGWLSKCTQNTRCRVLSVTKLDAILKGEAYIAYEVFQTHAEMHETDGRSSW